MLRPRFLITMFTLAVGLALGVHFLFGAGDTAAPAMAAASPAELPGVVTIARALPPGQILRPDDLAEVHWSGGGAPAGAIIAGTPAARQLAGAVTRRAFVAGELIIPGSVILPGDRSFLAALISPGNRAIALKVDATSAAGGLIWPGDHVDIILTQQLTDDSVPLSKRVLSETILTDVRILSTDQKLATAGGAGGAIDDKITPPQVVPTTVTVEVTPAEAERVTVGASLGQLALTLRGVASGARSVGLAEGAGATWAGGVSPGLVSIRHRQRETLSAAPVAPPVAAPAATPDARRAGIRIFRGSQGPA